MANVRIESMAYGGYGVARLEGFVYFVPWTAPGDVAEIEPVAQKKHYGFARLLGVIEPSPLRTEPFCPCYGDCGGCQLQHIRYSEQLTIKRKVFMEQLARIGGVVDLSEPPIRGSRARRSRMRFQVSEDAIGLFQWRTRNVCPIIECPVASHEVNKVLKALNHGAAREAGVRKGAITVLASPGHALISARLPPEKGRALYEGLGGTVKGGAFSHRSHRTVLGEPYLAMDVGDVMLYVPADSFWQANPEINAVLSEEICRFMGGMGTVYDFFCGCGNFSLPLARVCREVMGIEKDGHSVEAARYSSSRSGIRNLSFVAGDALDGKNGSPDGVVVDPPREGLSTTLIHAILRQRPGRIAYVSCNPSTLARDLAHFLKAGYGLHSIRLLDMFPHTYHIESLTFLTRS